MSARETHGCLTGTDGLYNPLLLSAVNNSEDLVVSVTDFVPGMLLDPLLDIGNGGGAMCFKSACLRMLALILEDFYT